MNYKVVPRIKAKGYPVGHEGYESSHKAAEKHEADVYGKNRYLQLWRLIRCKIPAGELAGTHTKNGQIKVSSKIPKKFHEQVAEHEKFEHARMERICKRRTIRRTRRR